MIKWWSKPHLFWPISWDYFWNQFHIHQSPIRR
jgi:hypothetical protein